MEPEKGRVKWLRLKAWFLIIQREASGLALMQQVAAVRKKKEITERIKTFLLSERLR